jgi:Recombinase
MRDQRRRRVGTGPHGQRGRSNRLGDNGVLMLDQHRRRGAASMKAAPDRFGANILSLTQPLRAEGKSLRDIADILNTHGVTTARGGKWAPTQITDILM